MVTMNILLTRVISPFPESTFSASLTRVLSFKSTFLRISSIRPAPTVVTPSPPVCIRRPRIICPNGVNVSPASTAISPVTHTALVDVYRESI